MKKIIFILALSFVSKSNAQNYLISFAGDGASTAVSSVKVENLTAGTSRTVNGTDILRLTSTVGISNFVKEKSSGIEISPNPMTDKSTLLVSAPDAGDAIISVSDFSGKIVTQIKSDLKNYTQEFTLSGLKKGIYIINIKGNTYQLSGKLISNGISDAAAKIERVNENISVNSKSSISDTKGVKDAVDMEYNTGDRIKFTGISGIYSTVITDIPAEDKTVTFNFLACTDGDGNNYPVVTIGTQVWMAENLKTTKYNDGTTSIPLVSDGPGWAALTANGYCWYNNDETAYKDTYGAIYNWYTVDVVSNGGNNVCPTGWHVPTDGEWTALTDLIGGLTVAGGKLKETGNTHWNSNYGASNEYGFNALPGGMRYFTGTFDFVRNYGTWWSATKSSLAVAWYRLIYNNIRDINRSNGSAKYGFSVRCIKD